MSEKRQKENGKHIVQRHYHAVLGVRHTEYTLENERHYVIVHFPEAHNAHKSEADEQGAFEVELHLIFACRQTFFLSEHIFLPYEDVCYFNNNIYAGGSSI